MQLFPTELNVVSNQSLAFYYLKHIIFVKLAFCLFIKLSVIVPLEYHTCLTVVQNECSIRAYRLYCLDIIFYTTSMLSIQKEALCNRISAQTLLSYCILSKLHSG